MDASIRKSFHSCNVLPIKSFFKALKYILSVDQVPLFWNFAHAKAIKMMELMRSKNRYIHLDVPDTGDLTKGPPSKMNSIELYKRERLNAAEQVKEPTNESPETLTPLLLPQVKKDHRSNTYSDHDSED